MDEKLSEDNGQTPPALKAEEEEMDVTLTTQLENLIVAPDGADTSSHPQTRPEEADVKTECTGETLSVDSVCKTGDCEDDDEEDSDRYYTNTQQSAGPLHTWNCSSLINNENDSDCLPQRQLFLFFLILLFLLFSLSPCVRR